MAIDCSCSVVSHKTHLDAAREHAPEISAARSFGAAVGVVFRETHPSEGPHCNGCTPHIGQAIIEAGLRTPEEFQTWKTRQEKARDGHKPAAKKCADCSNPGACHNIPKF